MKKILITGGAGFIGSHLCNFLINQNAHIICFDNFVTGNKKNITENLHKNNFELIEGDITSDINVHIDEIYHFACPASPIQYQINPVRSRVHVCQLQ